MSDITGSNSGRRGRARSHSVTSDELTADIDVLNGDEPSQSTHEPPAASTSPTGADSRQPTVSAKTAKILTLAGASKKREPESSLTLEEQEEQRLAEEEKLRLALKQVDLAEAETAKPKKPKGVDRQPDMTIKLLLLGDGGVGKTSLMFRYAEKKFYPALLSTAGVDYKTQFVEFEGKYIKCQIWDTAGQQRFHAITESYYRSAQGIILVYDAADPEERSFANVKHWMARIQKHATPQTHKIILGNKVDLPKQVSTERGQAVADEFGSRFLETSAKDGTNVAEAFHQVAYDIFQARVAAGTGGGGGGPGHGAPAGGGPEKDKKCVVQ